METKEFSSFPIPVSCTELDGGPTVITVERPSTRADLRIVFGSGATSDVLSGTAHVLEHLLLTEDVQPELRSVLLAGYEVGGETNQVMTQYTAQGPSSDIGGMVQALAACVSRPRFERPLFKREQRIVMNELRQNRYDVRKDAWQYELMYPNLPEMHLSNFGKDADIRRMRIADLKAYYEKHYVRRNAVVVAVGRIAHRQHVEAVMASPIMSLPEGVRREQKNMHFKPVNGTFSKSWVSSPGVYLYLPLPVAFIERRLVCHAVQLLIIDCYGSVYKRLRMDEGKIYSPYHEESDFPEYWACIGAEASKRDIPSIDKALRDEVAKLVAGDIDQDAWNRTKGFYRNFFDSIVEEESSWFLDYFVARWLRRELADRWFKDAVLNVDPAKISKLISARWRPERLACFRFVP